MSGADEWDEQVLRSRAALQSRQDATFGELHGDHWHYDLDEAVLEVLDHGALQRRFRIVVAGSASEAEGTWLWSWANETLPSAATDGIDRVREWGARCGYAGLTTPEWPADEHAIADVVSVAADLLGAEGFFRTNGPGGVSLYFLLDVAVSP